MIWSPCADGVRTYTERFMCQNRRTKPSTYILALANSKTSNSVSCVCSSHETVLSTRRHPVHPVSVPILPPREIQALWSQNHDRDTTLYYSKKSRQCNDLPSSVYSTRYQQFTSNGIAIHDTSIPPPAPFRPFCRQRFDQFTPARPDSLSTLSDYFAPSVVSRSTISGPFPPSVVSRSTISGPFAPSVVRRSTISGPFSPSLDSPSTTSGSFPPSIVSHQTRDQISRADYDTTYSTFWLRVATYEARDEYVTTV